jgi:alkylhydroperoxidase family enzyme
VDINSVRVTEIDGGDQKLAALGGWRESDAFSELERVALEYAERMTYTGQKVDDALFARLRAHFTEQQIVELSAAIALENFRSKFNPALGVDAQGFCLLPGERPR